MEPFKYHLYLCRQRKPEGAPSCRGLGAEELHAALLKAVAAEGLPDEVQVTACDCLGRCERGPNLVVYPEGVWYSGVKAADAPEIAREHLKNGRPVERLVQKDGAALKRELLDHQRKVAGLKALMDRSGMLPEEFNSRVRGFWESRPILTAIELDLFTAVGQGADQSQVAKALNTDPRATETLLNALVALELLSKEGGRFKNTSLGLRYLVAGAPDDSRAALMHAVNLWPRWSTLTEAVRQGTSVIYQPMTDRGPDWAVSFIAAMHKNASFAGPLVAAALDLSGVKSLLDLGGGSGAYSIAFAKKEPGLIAAIFDLPNVIPLARKYVADAGMTDRVSFRAGDMVKDDYGHDYDLVWVSAICHMWSPEENIALFKRILNALKKGGRVVIMDFILNDDKTAPRMGALFALNMLVGTRGGGTYSGKEYTSWLTTAGFTEAKVQPLPGPTALAIGHKI